MSNCESHHSCSCPPAPPGGTLYVFLHGLYGIVDSPSGIEVLIPDVGAAHTYRYGEFLGEVTLQPSSAAYQISNITGGQVHFDPNQHMVTTQSFAACSEPDLYGRIKLPLPLKIHSVVTVDLSGVIEDPRQHLSPKKIATMVPVLEYEYADPRKILFGCDPLDVAPVFAEDQGKKRAFINLHIFAEEDLERLEDHDIAGFSAVTSLFEFPCPPRLASLDNVPAPVVGTPPPGTTRLEFMSLALRTQELGYLGRFVRRQILHHRKHVMVEVSPVGADPITCYPVVNQTS